MRYLMRAMVYALAFASGSVPLLVMGEWADWIVAISPALPSPLFVALMVLGPPTIAAAFYLCALSVDRSLRTRAE